jgi:hypothetical protein
MIFSAAACRGSKRPIARTLTGIDPTFGTAIGALSFIGGSSRRSRDSRRGTGRKIMGLFEGVANSLQTASAEPI